MLEAGHRGGGVAGILAGVLFSYSIPVLYANLAEGNQALIALFGEKLNFMHGAFVLALLSALVHIVISLKTQPDEEKANSPGLACKSSV